MVTQEDYKNILNKVEKITKEKKLDLSSDEDLSIGIMNLISIEEHLFFTAQKTGKSEYFDLLQQVREMRKELLKKIIKEYEGEVWCISKHLLASSMRLIEVGTKQLNQGKKAESEDLFKKAYELYSLFWGLNLKLMNLPDVKKIGNNKEINLMPEKENKKPISVGIMGKLTSVINKILDCCRE